jgi:nicotinamide-nucleotide amidase
MVFIRKLDYRGVEKATYTADVLTRDEHGVVVQAIWTRPTARLGFVNFETGDRLRETFYNDRWYNIFEIFTPQGQLKGWYADITRPARIDEDRVEWEDLLLDIWMNPDGSMQVLDEDEFAQAQQELPRLEAGIARDTLHTLGEELLRRWRVYMNDQLAALLLQRGWNMGTAESCTGGLIGDELTNRAGSSDYFKGGIISYDNRVKQQALGVQAQTLAQYGAVSEQCAREMARGVRKALGLDVGVSATGIAGPGGGSLEKPVGLVYIGVSSPYGDTVKRCVWAYDRTGNKRATADAAFRLLVEHLKQGSKTQDAQAGDWP